MNKKVVMLNPRVLSAIPYPTRETEISINGFHAIFGPSCLASKKLLKTNPIDIKPKSVAVPKEMKPVPGL